jgi:hypothetical protein
MDPPQASDVLPHTVFPTQLVAEREMV